MAKRAPPKDDGRRMAEINIKSNTFDYSPDQWERIAESMETLQPPPEAIEQARERLQTIARIYYRKLFNGPIVVTKNKVIVRHWEKIERLTNDLEGELLWFREEQRKHGAPLPTLYQEELDAVLNLNLKAKISPFRGGDRFKPKIWYQSGVLKVWVALDGKLRFSRNPLTGKISGPLVRFFAAATHPVHGGSPESLPDAIKRYKAAAAEPENGQIEIAVG
jgi:hypothetical protein